jgi:pimeloyl-ACP methyl ester carboxylesterase
MREKRHWGSFPAIFREAVEGMEPTVEVVPLDLPGNGALHQMRSLTRIDAMVEYCRQALTAQNLQPPYSLLGISLGAMVTIAWAAKYPTEIQRCVLINTSLRPYNPFYQRLRARNYVDLLRLLLSRDVALREYTVLRITSHRAELRDSILGTWIDYQKEYPVSLRNALRQLLAAMRYHAPTQKPAAPILILSSSADQLVDPQCSEQIAQRWQAKLLTHPAAGHDLPLDDAYWVAHKVRGWLSPASC